MTIIVGTILVLMIVTGSDSLLLSPATRFELGLAKRPPPPCRPVTADERYGETHEEKGKAALWSTGGVMLCERTIYEPGERDSFYEFLTRNAPQRIERMVGQLSLLIRQSEAERLSEGLGPLPPWHVTIATPDPRIAYYLKTVMVHELTNRLGSRSVGRTQKPSSEAEATITVTVREVDQPDLVLSAEALIRDGERLSRWTL